jgi:putative oxidoreductase
VLSYFQPITLAALRIFAAFMFWQYAGQRLFGMFGGEQAAIFSPVWFVGLVEFVGSIAMGIGFLTRPVALILTAELLLFYLFHYLPQGFPPYGSRLGEHIVALLFVSGFLAFAGPGRFSVDGDLKAQRPRVEVPWFADGLERYYPRALGVFRILVALLYAQHGLPKLGIGGEAAAFLTQRWVAGVVELFGGAAIALGLLTRPVAFLASGQMAFAYFLSHAPRSFFPIENGGDRAAMFCFFFLCLVPAGPGAWAVDRWRRTRPPGDKVRVAAET